MAFVFHLNAELKSGSGYPFYTQTALFCNLDAFSEIAYTHPRRGVAQLEARCVWDAEARGSSPRSPTNSFNTQKSLTNQIGAFFVFCKKIRVDPLLVILTIIFFVTAQAAEKCGGCADGVTTRTPCWAEQFLFF